MSDRQPEVEVDARGLRCPLPVIRLAAAARDAAPGTQVVVLATDPAARHDVPAWCRMRGHTLAEVREAADGGHTAYRVVVGAPAAPQGSGEGGR
ncbi:MAG: sulfurtransferase TusA family protein [Oryzihumus sp.]